MKIKKGFELHDVCGENVIVSHGVENIDFSKIISLNETAAYLWNELLGRDFDLDEVVRLLTDAYEVTPEVARADAEKLLAQWVETGLVD